MGLRKLLLSLVVFVVFTITTFPLSLRIAGGERSPEDYERVNKFTMEGWDFKLGKSLRDLRAVGRVVRELTTVVANPHVGNQKDEIRELFYDGLYIVAYFPAKDHSFLLLQVVEVTKQRFRIKHGLNVGVSVSKIKSVLGDPDEVNDNVYIYRGEANTAYFYIQDGLVTKVRWELYID